MPPASKRPTPSTRAAAASSAVGGAAALLAASEAFLAAAIASVPNPQTDGMLPVVDDAHALPEVIENIEKAMKVRVDAALELPIHPALKDMYAAVHDATVAVQNTTAQIGPLFESIHRDKLDELRNPPANAQMWDQRANQGV